MCRLFLLLFPLPSESPLSQNTRPTHSYSSSLLFSIYTVCVCVCVRVCVRVHITFSYVSVYSTLLSQHSATPPKSTRKDNISSMLLLLHLLFSLSLSLSLVSLSLWFQRRAFASPVSANWKSHLGPSRRALERLGLGYETGPFSFHPRAGCQRLCLLMHGGKEEEKREREREKQKEIERQNERERQKERERERQKERERKRRREITLTGFSYSSSPTTPYHFVCMCIFVSVCMWVCVWVSTRPF